jgi:hypothetical protein
MDIIPHSTGDGVPLAYWRDAARAAEQANHRLRDALAGALDEAERLERDGVSPALVLSALITTIRQIIGGQS